jgi:hypothetical protein
LPNHVFRALVLPAAALQALTWLAAAQTLLALGGATLTAQCPGFEPDRRGRVHRAGAVRQFPRHRGRGLPLAATLRHGRLFRRHLHRDVVVRAALQSLYSTQRLRLPRRYERVLLALLALIVALGLGNALAGAWPTRP